MRVLAIETSSARGSVALIETGRVVAEAGHERPNAHAEEILPLVRRLLGEAGWASSSLDRIGVGIGPGSFTGLRVGIALAQGLGLGLDRPVVGVGSLRAMARGVPPEHPGARCALLDARRDEVFLAIYDEPRELVAPRAVPRSALLAAFAPDGELAPSRLPGAPAELVLVGESIPELEASRPGLSRFASPDTELPSARWVGILAGELDPGLHPAEPIYVRGAGATLPDLPPSPLSS